MSFNNISFILHQPQLSENIGACARAVKNFNFKKLIIVKPKPIFPNDKILATSVGAKDLIINAKVHETLESAVKKVDYVIATSARFRNKNIKHINLEELKKIDFNKKIVLIENADPGFDWLFNFNIKGLITKFGGANSHMSIRCNELKIPAAIGVGEKIFEDIKDNDQLILNCALKKIEAN